MNLFIEPIYLLWGTKYLSPIYKVIFGTVLYEITHNGGV